MFQNTPVVLLVMVRKCWVKRRAEAQGVLDLKRVWKGEVLGK